MKSYVTFLCCSFIFVYGCVSQISAPPDDVALVEQAARQFLHYAHDFNYTAFRAAATSDYEMLYDGRRLDMDGFLNHLRDIEERRAGRKLSGYELADVNTKIIGNVAYIVWSSARWLESLTFVWSGDRWLVSRAYSMRVKAE